MYVMAGALLACLLSFRVPVGASLMFLACWILAWSLAPRVIRFALSRRILAWPGGRQNHARPTPLLGGLLIYALTSTALITVGVVEDARAFGVLAGGTCVFVVGLLDDVYDVTPRIKIYTQLLGVACLLLAGFGVGTVELKPLGRVDLTLWSPVILTGWIVLATNAFNIVDGLDGLASGLALIAALSLAALGIWPLAFLAMAGALLGVLYFNLPRARLFLGDAGSLYLGFVLAASCFLLPASRVLPFGVALFAYPLGDCVLTIARRVVRGQPLLRPDRSHIHHKALTHLGSHTPVLLMALLFSVFQVLMATAYPGLPSLLSVILGWAAIAMLLVAAGQYNLSTVMATREPVQRLHVVTRYVRDSIRLASTPQHVVTALQHLTEGIGLRQFTLPAFDVAVESRTVADVDLRHHRVALLRGEARWSDARGRYDPRVEIERETNVVQIARLACERLEYLTTDTHLTTVEDAIPAVLPRDIEDETPSTHDGPRPPSQDLSSSSS